MISIILFYSLIITSTVKNADSKAHGANMGPTWVLSSPGGQNVGPMNLAIWEVLSLYFVKSLSAASLNFVTMPLAIDLYWQPTEYFRCTQNLLLRHLKINGFLNLWGQCSTYLSFSVVSCHLFGTDPSRQTVLFSYCQMGPRELVERKCQSKYTNHFNKYHWENVSNYISI